jgi:hypothetical protein
MLSIVVILLQFTRAWLFDPRKNLAEVAYGKGGKQPSRTALAKCPFRAYAVIDCEAQHANIQHT